MPYLRAIMDSRNDPLVTAVVLMKSGQTGGTEVINNVVGYGIDQDPGPMLVLQPTIEMGHTWSKDRLAPMLRDTPALNGKVKDRRAKDSENTILHKVFPGGHVTIAGANSPAGLAARPIRDLLADEVDRYPQSAGAEGDPLNLAKKRTTTFWNRKIFVVSTPTIKGVSRIEAEFEASDMQYYFVPCPHCKEMLRLRWAQVKWPDGEPSKACYVCEKCGAEVYDTDKPGMLLAGEWRPSKPFNGVRGFHISELYSPWVKFGEMATAFCEAKKLPDTLKTWVNTALGETWEEQGDQLETNRLIERVENYQGVPEGVIVLTAAVDVQDDRLECEVQGWGRDFESWGIEHSIIWGDPSRPQIWQQLDEFLLREWQDHTGRGRRIAAVTIDSGGHHTQDVYRFCRTRYARRVFAIKGFGGQGRPLVGRPTRGNSGRVRVFPVGVDTAKDIVFSHLKIDKVGPGYCHFPATYDNECFEQLTSEKVVTKYVRGFPKRVYVKTRARNEMLDLRVYNRAALELLNVNLNKLADRQARGGQQSRQQVEQEAVASDVPEQALAKRETYGQAELRKRVKKPGGRGPGGGGFVNNW